VRESPRDAGPLELVVVRPAPGGRDVLQVAHVDPAVGIRGDSWTERGSSRTPDGGPNPEAQVTVMNSRAADLVAGSRERWALAGDQLFRRPRRERDEPAHRHAAGHRRRSARGDGRPHRVRAVQGAVRRRGAAPDGDTRRRELRLRGINTRVLSAGDPPGDTVRVERPA
jgi:hypothetical protein